MHCVSTLNSMCLCEGERERERESFPLLAISPCIEPLEPIQPQLKRVGYNWRHRPAINLPSIP